MKKAFLTTFVFLLCLALHAQELITKFEKTDGKETATYFETIKYYEQLDKKFDKVVLKTFDTVDAGYPLHLVLFSNDQQYIPKKWHQQGKIVILINNGIHPGEPDGIDASMMLLRDAAMGKVKIPDNVVLAIIPVYNIGGALNRNSFSRVNQQGPSSYGFRGNAQNLDLNRDFTKSDSKNSKAFARIFHFLDPDILVDNHVSDGADYQYTMTMLTTQSNKLGGPLSTFLHNTLEPALYENMLGKNFEMTPYVDFAAGNFNKGWAAFYDPPRYSSGYATLFQTIGFVPETHMLKPYKQRVHSTYTFMQALIEESSKTAPMLKTQRQAAINVVQNQKAYPLAWKVDTTKFETLSFKGYEAVIKQSAVTSMPRIFYDHSKPYTRDVKFFNTFKAVNIVTAPKAYIIPQGWHNVIDLLKLNNVKMARLKSDTLFEVEAYRIEDYKSMQRPYEKHHKNFDVIVSTNNLKMHFLKGDYIIYCNQRANRYIVEMLEPTGDDSFFAWNFFDAILQQKEGYSDYRWEDVAEEYVKAHPELKTQLEVKKLADTTFAASASAQLNFIYKNSPYYEPAHMRYPVYRLLK